MASAWRTLVAFLAAIGLSLAIECYTGWTYVKGQPFATGQETCDQKNYCYNLTLDSQGAADGVKKAGCSNWRCKIAGDGCHSFGVSSQKATFCCCKNRDKCNSKYSQLKTIDRLKEGVKDAKSALEDLWKKMENPFG